MPLIVVGVLFQRPYRLQPGNSPVQREVSLSFRLASRPHGVGHGRHQFFKFLDGECSCIVKHGLSWEGQVGSFVECNKSINVFGVGSFEITTVIPECSQHICGRRDSMSSEHSK